MNYNNIQCHPGIAHPSSIHPRNRQCYQLSFMEATSDVLTTFTPIFSKLLSVTRRWTTAIRAQQQTTVIPHSVLFMKDPYNKDSSNTKWMISHSQIITMTILVEDSCFSVSTVPDLHHHPSTWIFFSPIWIHHVMSHPSNSDTNPYYLRSSSWRSTPQFTRLPTSRSWSICTCYSVSVCDWWSWSTTPWILFYLTCPVAGPMQYHG